MTVVEWIHQARLLVNGEEGLDGKEHATTSVDTKLAERLAKVQLNQDNLVGDTRWQYVATCMDLIDQFFALEHQEVSVNDQKVVFTLLDIIVVWGISRYLLLGVGVGISQRISNISISQEDRVNNVKSSNGSSSSSDSEFLVQSCRFVYRIGIQSNDELIKTYIGTNHLQDLIGGLLQLACVPANATNEKQWARGAMNDVLETVQHSKLLPALFGLLAPKQDKDKKVPKLPPVWLRRICGKFLTTLLLRDNGVRYLLEFLLVNNRDEENTNNAVDSDELDHVSNIVLTPPTQQPKNAYYKSILPQLLTLFRSDSTKLPALKACSLILSRLVYKQPGLSKDLFLDEMIQPLTILVNSSVDITELAKDKPTDLDGNAIIVTETELDSSLSELSRLLLDIEPNDILTTILADTIPPLFHLSLFYNTRQTSSLSQSPSIAKSLLTYLLRFLDMNEIVFLLDGFLLGTVMNPLIDFSGGDQGGAQIIAKPTGSDHIMDESLIVSTFVELLSSCERDELPGAVFLELLKRYEFGKRMENVGNDDGSEDEDDEDSEEIMSRKPSPQEMLLYIRIVMAMIDQFGPKVLSQPGQILRFVKSTLIHDGKKLSGEVVNESQTLAFGVLGILLAMDVKFEGEDQEILQEVMIILQTIGNSDSSPSSDDKHDDPAFLAKGLKESVKKKVDTNTDSTVITAFNTSIHALSLPDTDIPTRARHLTQLRHLILARHDIIQEQLDTVLDVCLNQLRDDDSFVYLNAVRCISALADSYAKKVMKRIADKYSQPTTEYIRQKEAAAEQDNRTEEKGDDSNDDDDSEDMDDEDSDYPDLDYRLRLGEALLQTIQRAGRVFAKHADALVPSILLVLHDPSRYMRSSAQSLIAEIAETNPFSLVPFMYQLKDYVENLLILGKKTENVETRRGAVFILRSVIVGLGSTLLSGRVIPGDVLRDIYKRLKIVKEDLGEDDIVRGHAEVALEELEHVVMGLLGRVVQ